MERKCDDDDEQTKLNILLRHWDVIYGTLESDGIVYNINSVNFEGGVWVWRLEWARPCLSNIASNRSSL